MLGKRFAFKLDTLSLLQDDKAFAALAEKYEPQEGLNYVAFTYHATAPEVNMKAMAITPATMQASLASAVNTMVDYEHRAEDLDIPRDDDGWETEVMGHIVEVAMDDIPAADDTDAWMVAPHIPNEPIVTRGVMALYTRIFKVMRIAREVRRGASWFFSLEIGEGVTEPAIWLRANDEKGHEIIPWSQAPEDLRQIASQPKMMEYDGRGVAYLMGGVAGEIPFIGGAITSNPAGLEQRQPGNSLMLVASVGGAIQGFEHITPKWAETSKEGKIRIKKQLETYRQRLITGKEGNNDTSDDSGIIEPIVLNSYEDTLDFYKTVDDVMKVASSGKKSDTGGDKMEITQEELDKKLADARTEAKTAGFDEGKAEGQKLGAEGAVEKAVEDGTHFAAADVIRKDEVDGIVEKRLMSKVRKAAIDGLTCDDEMKADFHDIASNEDKYPLDADGETKFAESLKRWEASLKTASDDGNDDKDKDKDTDKDEGKSDKKTASEGDKDKKDFDPGAGGSGSDGDDAVEDIPSYTG